MTHARLFNQITRQMLDAWVGFDSQRLMQVEEAYLPILDKLSMRMRLTQYSPTEANPLDWHMKPLRHNGGSITRMIGLKNLFIEGRIGEFRDRDYVQSALIPSLVDVVETQTFSIEVVKSKIIGINIVYDRLLLPQRHPERPEWVLSLTHARLMMQEADSGKNDFVDDVIVQLLAEGASAKEIAEQAGISKRTVEHRIERMKQRHGARNATHLVAMMLAATAASSNE